MSRLMLTADLHLGHNNIAKHRPQFSSAEEHHEVVYDNLLTTIRKRDTLYILGDAAFDKHWLSRLAEIKNYVKLVVGNHDLHGTIKMQDLVNSYDSVEALFKKRNVWFSHCPIHPDEFRKTTHNIHGHAHDHLIENPDGNPDRRYINVCVEHTDFKPITFEEAMARG